LLSSHWLTLDAGIRNMTASRFIISIKIIENEITEDMRPEKTQSNCVWNEKLRWLLYRQSCNQVLGAAGVTFVW